VTSVADRIRNRLVWERHTARTEQLRDEHPLRYLFLEVTRRCNLACKYCGSSCTGRQPEGELTIPEWIEVVEQVAGDFDPSRVMVAVTGGEPLLKEGVFELFAALRRLGFRYGMVSNGQLLDLAMARRLVRVGMGSISLSMDGVPEVNDALRGRGAADKVIAAIANLRAAGYTGKLEIISTITRPALARLDEMRRFVASLRVPMWRVAPVMPIGRAAENPELVPTADDVRALLEYVRASRRDRMLPTPEFSEEGFLGNRFEGQVRPYLCQCRAGITIAGIHHDGRIGACPELPAAFDQGHVRTDRFKTVWEERYQDLRDRSWTKKGACASCAQYRVCKGGALHLYESTESTHLRCLYLQCKEAESHTVALGEPA
jgi:radical SAM protein with 4Fe4S-binding SPASM domain